MNTRPALLLLAGQGNPLAVVLITQHNCTQPGRPDDDDAGETNAQKNFYNPHFHSDLGSLSLRARTAIWAHNDAYPNDDTYTHYNAYVYCDFYANPNFHTDSNPRI